MPNQPPDTNNPIAAPQALAAIVDTCQPDSVVSCGTLANLVTRHWHQQCPNTRLTVLDPAIPNGAFPLPHTHDLALISDTLEYLSHDDGQLLLGQLRNYGTHQIAVVIDSDAPWHFQDFLALGFRRQGQVESGEDGKRSLTLYTYKLDSYNHKRQWNNPDYWANPEMWGKAWW